MPIASENAYNNNELIDEILENMYTLLFYPIRNQNLWLNEIQP